MAFSGLLFDAPGDSVPLDKVVMRRSRNYGFVTRLNAMWHSSLPGPPVTFRAGFVFYAFDITPIACAMWGKPSARLEDQDATLELKRFANGPSVPYNFGSWALARMREWIRENMPEIVRVISYQDADTHHGTIYKADNWRLAYEKFNVRTWTSRSNRMGNERRHKIKWEREP